MARIFIVGSGVVGTATGKGFIEAGHTVTFIDVALARLEQLRAEGFDARFTLDLPDEPSYVFMTLPTPNVGKSFDLSAFTSGTRSIADAIRRSPALHTIVVRSTVPPGTTEGLVLTELEFGSGKQAGIGFALASNPEFLRAATAAEDFRHPWMTVIASRDEATCLRLRELLAPFGGELKIFDDPAVAETIKCAHNLFNAAKISFWNEIWLVTESSASTTTRCRAPSPSRRRGRPTSSTASAEAPRTAASACPKTPMVSWVLPASSECACRCWKASSP